MSGEQTNPGPGEQGAQPSGEAPSNSLDTDAIVKALGFQLGEIVDQRLDAFRGEFEKDFESVRNLRGQLQRHVKRDGSAAGDPKGAGESTTEPSEAEREQAMTAARLAKLEAKEEALAIREALDDGMKAVAEGLADGAGDTIRDLVAPYLKRNSRGEVVHDRDGKHRPVSEVIGELSERPIFKAPARREVPNLDGKEIRGAGPAGQLDVKGMDTEAFRQLHAQVKRGEVRSLNRSE